MTDSASLRLFDVDIRHDYFADGRCGVTDVRPTEPCLRTLARYGLQWAPRPAGGALYLWQRDAATIADSVFVRGWNEATPLTFSVWSRDASIDDYTEGAGRAGADVYYFSNVLDDASTLAAGDRIRLHRLERPLASSACLQSLAACGPRRPWAVIEIFVGGPTDARVPATRSLLSSTRTPTQRQFAIDLAARATTWRYYVLPAAADWRPADGATLTLVAGKQTIAFGESARARIPGGLVLDSAEPVRFAANPRGRFRLTLEIGGTNARSITLPMPPPGSSRIERTDTAGSATNAVVVSEQYVHV
jgi:hypothetical protein